MFLTKIKKVVGVDFSGAALAGKTAWIAELSCRGDERLELSSLHPIGELATSDERAFINRYLVDRISASDETLFGFDFPFGLPVELEIGTWRHQLSNVRAFDGDARQYGLHLVELTRSKLGSMHVRRQTDTDSKTPFDCYHYRIIYQTFHGMRDVLAMVANEPETAVLPFQYAKADTARRWVVEACPSSTLKRLSLPSRLYKQTGGGTLTDARREVRRQILRGLVASVEIPTRLRRKMMDNLGGDALDAVIAGLGAWASLNRVDHASIAKHGRYPREGYVYH